MATTRPHWWSDEHLHRYVEEHTFRLNDRSRHVTDRMAHAAAAMPGRRLSRRQFTAHGTDATKGLQVHA